MKKMLVSFVCLFLLLSCGKNVPYLTHSVPLEAEVSGNTELPTFEGFLFPSLPPLTRSSEIREAVLCSRGWLFIDGSGVTRVYSPAAGTVNALCSDPLCSHAPDSDCAFRSCAVTGVPVQAGDRLWVIDKDPRYLQPEYAGRDILPAWSVCSTDLFGHDKKTHYRNDGTELCGLYAEEDAVWWIERVGDEQTLLTRMDPRSGKIERMPCGEDAHKIIIEFVRLGDFVFYILDDGMIRFCRSDFSDDSFVSQTKGTSLYASDSVGKVYWKEAGGLVSYNPDTGNTETAITPPEGFCLHAFIPSGSGFAYTLAAVTGDFISLYESFQTYQASVEADAALYLWGPETGITERIALPVSVMPSPLCSGYEGGILFTMRAVQNDWTKVVSWKGWYACLTETGEVWEVEP